MATTRKKTRRALTLKRCDRCGRTGRYAAGKRWCPRTITVVSKSPTGWMRRVITSRQSYECRGLLTTVKVPPAATPDDKLARRRRMLDARVDRLRARAAEWSKRERRAAMFRAKAERELSRVERLREMDAATVQRRSEQARVAGTKGARVRAVKRRLLTAAQKAGAR